MSSIISDRSVPRAHEKNEDHFSKKYVLRAALYLLPPANVDERQGSVIDDRLKKLLLLAEDNDSRTIPDIEKTLNLNADNRKHHEKIIKCIIKILQNGVHNESIKQLLEIATVNGNLTVAEMLLKPKLKSYENGLNEMTVEDVNAYLGGLLQKCCNRGHDSILKYLLSIIPKTEKDFINEDPLLCCVLKETNPYDSTYPGFQRCLSLLLEDDRVLIDRAEVNKRTPLYYATRQRNEDAQKQLLAKGACLGTMDMRQRMPVHYIDPILLEEHLNICITDNKKHLLDDGYELTLDFKNFIHKQTVANSFSAHNGSSQCTTNLTDSVTIELNLRNEIPNSSKETSLRKAPHTKESSSLIASERGSQKIQKTEEQMENKTQEINQQLPESELSTILELAQDSANHRVLQHPVISCILAIKQADLYWFRWLYCLYYLLHYILLMSVWIWCNNATDNCVTITVQFQWFTVGVMIYMATRWLIWMSVDFLAWKLKLIPKISNLVWQLLWRLIQLVPISLLVEIMYKKGYPSISAISMIVLAIESTLVLLKIQWRSISTNLIMFMRVLQTFCESLIPFSTIIISFLISFHILFKDSGKKESTSLNQNTTQTTQNAGEEMSTSDGFQTIEETGRKVFIMMAGELSTEKMDLQTVPRALMFFSFLLVIVIVWNNFMNSLAVDDTVGMRAKSQFLAIKQDVIFMKRLETILKILERAEEKTYFRWLCVCRWPQLKPLRPQITIKPNDDHPVPGVQIDKKIAYICKTIIQKNEQNSMVQ
ncbi:uncharacterized protein LOC126581290 [Anopheles aquasalis]|uniref:uncharacterized protein LOC126581290 n=1 Tax=Anopheles aquasalis TaxID=42839 RepID=UPI00215AF7DD|nr:uncharacterized protein LOC126581290 [Anopheles aquasalis]